jgi:hypothetical protein
MACYLCGDLSLEGRVSNGGRRETRNSREINPELVNMTRRFCIGLALTLLTLLLIVSSLIPGDPSERLLDSDPSLWLEFRGALERLATLSPRLDGRRKPASKYADTRYRKFYFTVSSSFRP